MVEIKEQALRRAAEEKIEEFEKSKDDLLDAICELDEEIEHIRDQLGAAIFDLYKSLDNTDTIV